MAETKKTTTIPLRSRPSSVTDVTTRGSFANSDQQHMAIHPAKLGEAIRLLRERKKLRQEDVANAVQVSQGHYSKIETKGLDCPVSLLSHIADELGVRLYELVAMADGVALADQKKLTIDEADVLADYRQLPPEGRKIVRAVLSTLTAGRKKPKET